MSDFPDIDDEKLEAINGYLNANNMLDFYQGMLVGNVEQHILDHPQIPKKFWNEAIQEPTYDDFLRHIIPIYDEYYTTQELNVLTEFFNTGIGQKFIKTVSVTDTLTRVVVDHFSKEFKMKVMAAAEKKK